MPEIGEVARVVHYLRKHIVGRTIASCNATNDDIVYGKVGCSAAAFQSAVTNRKVTGADQQGKYFYMTFDRPPHAVMHLGMTGWMKFDAEETHYYRQGKETEAAEPAEWPPKYSKFILRCEKETIDGEEKSAVECAFVDARRLARIRLVDCDAAKIRSETPLKENGPDPVRDKDIVTVEWLTDLLRRKKVPVKALLLDQANISGVGNWVADEVLYQARVHPEQYSNTFGDEQIKSLHQSLLDVTGLAVATLADSKQFPDDWLMKYRWDKGKKDSNVLPNGEKIVHLKVGGRTSAVVPSRQKKTGAVAGDIDDMDSGEQKEAKPAKTPTNKRKKDEEVADEKADEADEKPAKKGRGRPKKEKVDEVADGPDENVVKRGRGRPKKEDATPRLSQKAAKPVTKGTRKSSRSKA